MLRYSRSITVDALRLRRRTVRKGFAFPAASIFLFREAAPQQRPGGAASKSIGSTTPGRQSLSARCSGRAAKLSLLLFGCLFMGTGCRMDMQDQPKMKPYRSSTFFSDGLSTRPRVEGTVPRGFLMTDSEYFTGKKLGRSIANPGSSPAPTATTAGGSMPTGAAAYPDDVEVFPIPVTKELVHRGKERYEIFCSACHGFTGNGDGMIVRRGFRRAAAFNDDRLRQAPVGHFFDAITNGWGAMPSYAAQVPVQDRWAIIAYIRALQLKHEEQQSLEKPAATPAATPTEGTRH